MNNTYYVPFETPSINKEAKNNNRIEYYQWVPFMLIIQALLFYIPNIFWALTRPSSPLNVNLVLNFITSVDVIDPDKRSTVVNNVSKFIDKTLKIKTQICNIPMLSMLYFITKLLYVSNVLFQFICLTKFLGGKEIFKNLLQGNESVYFPRITFCDLSICELGNVHIYSIQCVLAINTLNEKIFIFLWFWLIFVTSCTMFNFAYWIIIFITNRFSFHMLFKYKHICDTEIMRKFLHDYLICDGMLLLRVVHTHADYTVLADLILKLYNVFLNQQSEMSNYYSE